jgi:hypothetical protein
MLQVRMNSSSLGLLASQEETAENVLGVGRLDATAETAR